MGGSTDEYCTEGDCPGSCLDFDECDARTHKVKLSQYNTLLKFYFQCQELSNCENTDGSYICNCESGFSGYGQSCANIDDCAQSTNDCVDIDECTENTHNCDTNASCTN